MGLVVTPSRMVVQCNLSWCHSHEPFEVIYGQNPPSLLSYLLGISKVQEVDKTLTY
jgi:hypothetical protein